MGLLDSVTKEAPQLPSRVVLYAPEKAGKTSFGCHAPDPIFLMTRGETGLLSLIESGEVPPTAHFPNDFPTWPDLTEAVGAIAREQHSHKTLVLDTGNGAEQLLLAHVCEKSFGGDWGEFNSYGRGLGACIPVWADFLAQLDALRVKRRMAVLFLHHSRVKAFQNPTGKDWDQWKPEAVDKLWSLTHKWADVIAFYGSRVKVWNDKAEGKEERFLRCAPSAAIVAGNRYGMRDEITAAAGAENLWKAFAGELIKAKSKGKAQQPKVANKPAQQPASPPPPPPPAQVQAPAPTSAPATEGEQSSDPTRAKSATSADTAPAPATTTAATTSVPSAATPSAGATKTPAPTEAAKPMPSAERRTTPDNSPSALLALMHHIDVAWSEIRDRIEGKGLDIANKCGVYATPEMRFGELALSVRERLGDELRERAAKLDANREKRAANKAAREAVA